MLKLVYFLLIALSFSCQFKAEEEGGDLVAGHKEVTNSFTVSVPSAGTRNVGDVLTFVLTHPYNVTVTGTPRLTLTIGAATVYANYASGDGSKSIVFTYTILAGETDTNGIAVASTIDLNGGTLTYTGTQGLANCPTSISVPSTANVTVDTTDPTITLVSTTTGITRYVNQTMTFSMTMSEATTVTGTPRLELDIGGTPRYANYVSGSGTTTLLFSYTVVSTDLDGDGIDVVTPVDLNGGTMKDSVGNDAVLAFAAPVTTTLLVNGNIPYVVSVTPPANGSYGLGDNLDFVLNYSEVVNVTNFPSLTLTIGATGRLATYYSGSGTTQLTFRYVIQAGETDSNGIASAAILGMGGGALIRDASLTSAVNGFTVPSLTGVIVVDDRPRISSFLINSATYFVGQTFTFTALFNEAVTITGTPRIQITLNSGGPIYATYSSGSGTSSIVFSYTVADGTDDNNGVVFVSPLELNSGTIRSVSGNVDANLTYTLPTTTNLRISGTRPTITSITPPANATYTTGQNLDFIVNFSENVVVGNSANVRLNITIGSTSRQALYQSGTGTSAITFRYPIVLADSDVDGIAVNAMSVTSTGYISDFSATNNLATNFSFSAPNTTGVLVNATVPTVSSINPVAGSTYRLGQNIDFVLNYSEAVTITGSPRLTLTVGATTRYATYQAGSGGTAITFRHTVTAPDVDTDGITASTTLDNNGGTVRSALGLDASTTLPAQVLTTVLVDGDVPNVVSVTLPANSIYEASDVDFSFQVVFDQAVTVTAPNPRLVLDVGGTTRYANYVSGTGTTTLTFTHTINAADIDLNGIALANSNNIDLNGGTLQDASGNSAELALGSHDLSRVIISYAGLAAWYDPSDATTLTTAACGIQTCVSAMTDKAGTGYNLSAAGTAQPEILASGFGTGNSAYLKFDDSTDIMNMVTITNMRTVIMVFETEAAAMTTQDLFFSTAGGVTARVQITAGGALSYGGTQTAAYSLNGSALSGAATTHATGLAAATPYILVVRFAANQSPAANHRIGNTNFGGKFAEMMVFRSVSLSDAQLLPIINYLNNKHGAY